jgi:hypothetical protein
MAPNKYIATEISNIHRDPANTAECTKHKWRIEFCKFWCQLHFCRSKTVISRISDNDKLTLKIDVDFTAYDISNLRVLQNEY